MTVRRAEKKDTPRIQQLLWQVEQVHHRIRPDLFRDGGRCRMSGAGVRPCPPAGRR